MGSGGRLFFFFFFLIFRAALETYESSQARQLQLQLPAYTTATAMQDLSHVYKLHHNSRQHWIPDPLSEARN